jgi:1-aminocyclopropane-1-carboxylate deaminase/D-cysteine desulfhydrase-like pyridoxal-dependent ACC family enzyme
MNSIFSTQSIDRKIIKWENYLKELTPIQQVGNIMYKREDFFAPLGYNSVNGSKMRQCIWLINDFVIRKGARGIVSGSVVGSPQHPMIASICKHYGLGCVITTGTRNIEDHEYLVMAKNWGAVFHASKVGYAKTLQSTAFKLQKRLYKHEVVETNITVDAKLNSAERIYNFHLIGSHQVANIPDTIENLIIPCGSCNSVTSILLGLHLHPKPNIKRIYFMGIGNNGSNDIGYIDRRLESISKVIGSSITNSLKNIKRIHHNLNGTGYCSYSDMMEFSVVDGDIGIDFHPRYEGKIMNYIAENMSQFEDIWNNKTLFWIVGSNPKLQELAKA